jgi:reverse gyrase
MKVHNRACPSCGNQIEDTRTRSEICRVCTDAKNLTAKFNEDRLFLEGLGYIEIKNPTLNQHKQRVWSFTHPVSKIELTMTFNNLKTLLKRNPARIPGTK